ncbi:macrophage mannose receptor 1-like [Mytilus edulis]|uniref:macrophage mannose receptor 1-like n=1 Tax=Mytilus edulis TaxID=6550 RepID=UPI0039EEAD1E
MYDIECLKQVPGSCESDWTKIGSLCYKKLHESGSGVTYSEARILCTNENAKVMMPQSKNEAKLITTTLNCGLNCWVGLADFDADHIYTWEDGTEESQSNLYFGNNEPNHRNLDYICAYIENDTFFNRECTATENVICEIAAIENLSTTTTVQFSIETERTLADITTMMKTSPFTTNPSTAATESTTLHYTTASGNPGKEMHTKDMPSTLQALTVSATQLTCINKCTTHSSSYVNGTAGAIMNMPYKVDVKSLSSPGENIWVGLRFLYGADWTWDGGSLGSITSGDKSTEPQLCIGVWSNGFMFDYHCFSTSGVICQRSIDGSGNCDPGWEKFGGTMCYKRLRHFSSGLRFKNAKILCSTENAYIMMPQSQIDAKSIATALDCGNKCWIGITDFDADHTYTWEDGTNEIQSNLYFGLGEPNHRDQHYMCAFIQDGPFNNGECADTKKVICEIDASDRKTTTMSVSGMVCIDKCTSYCSEYTNGSVDARQNVPYRVDRKSLSSYRRRHRSEPDPRTSSLYIGCVGCVILIMTVLFIIMLDFLPSA